jgi:hypothetical protein
MRLLIVSACLLTLVSPACSKSTPPTSPSSTTAVLTLRAPSQAAVRLCVECANGDLEVGADIVVEETGGVGGTIMSIDVLLRNGSTVLAGPGQYNAANVATFAGGTNRVSARGSLTVRNVAMHFPATTRAQLPATFTLNVTFRDDNAHTITALATVQVVP